MKIVYHFGNQIGFDTIVKKGTITDMESQISIIGSDEFEYKLNNLKEVKFVKINALGTMIRVTNGNDVIYLAVPRFFINKGTGFMMVNYLATKKLGKMLLKRMSVNVKDDLR